MRKMMEPLVYTAWANGPGLLICNKGKSPSALDLFIIVDVDVPA